MLLGACGKINDLKYAGEKVTKTVVVCTEAATNVMNEDKKSSVSVGLTEKVTGGADSKASYSWDTRMMLW